MTNKTEYNQNDIHNLVVDAFNPEMTIKEIRSIGASIQAHIEVIAQNKVQDEPLDENVIRQKSAKVMAIDCQIERETHNDE